MLEIREKLILSRPLYLKDDDCGYCHHKKSQKEAISVQSWSDYYALNHQNQTETPPSISIGFQVENMTVEHYDQLINRGFRRSGTFLYKPDMLRGCCRMYTIRTNMDMFKLTKEHRQTVNKFNKRIGIEGGQDVKGKNGYDLMKELRKMDDSGKLVIKFEPSKFTKEKYKLFTKYQNHVHDDYKTSEKSFKRFLCDTPFSQNDAVIKDNKVLKFGATHQCYYLDSKLIAIGFLDILPSGVSSIYLIYDPDYRDLAMGKISGLKEMELTKKLGLDYYYLGYFIEDCPKMNYKRKFGGELLNLTDLTYHKLDDISDYITNGKYCAINSKNENIVEDLYGINSKEFLKAKEYSDKWPGISYSDVDNSVLITNSDDNSTPYDIPTVIPGVTSLETLFENWNTNQIKSLVFADGMIRPAIYDLETATIRKILIDTIRILGQGLANDAIIFI
ncbi:Arginyl-tRNA-protein transferase 1 [Wickerhamomyces ciferrii]|uniref:arginyltransferase n=1 Tax=Wickerhamomyces ciferrii (strain ATCC 14091 / BCRC 22168 / CBS 111 / JCM 3599 / NBRC 0793 / NRRL Y-1031 F-60-10) TaxID=1206466 RepID=K0KT04_WICCF|nr:Arginyl-tRNA-protein transferase 1 [Wickerhamomyces ciferrii]CCH44509.1 Arginyl-tRNA-protein transferase 1 [Wickerhamomyces ciferrii]